MLLWILLPLFIYIYRFAENATKERRTNYPNIHDANLGFLDLANAIEEMGATVQYVSLSWEKFV